MITLFYLSVLNTMSNTATINLHVSASERQDEADALAQRLNLPQHESAQFTLSLTQTRLQLCLNGPAAPGPVYVDFVGGKAAHRRQFGGGRGQPIAKAVGLKSGITPHILDATAGLGRDSFVFASLGCQVTMLEQNPIIAALLADGLQRGLADDDVAQICQRMSLINADSCLYLQQSTKPADVVYLDPMYPHRDKSAQIKKEMRLFQLLLGEPGDNRALLAAALQHATKRVVVKRPKGAESLPGRPPTMTINSKNTRYDVYVLASMADKSNSNPSTQSK